jgi:hypothetical protein
MTFWHSASNSKLRWLKERRGLADFDRLYRNPVEKIHARPGDMQSLVNAYGLNLTFKHWTLVL